MSKRYVAKTDVGRQRSHNEDSVLATELQNGAMLLAVADGMGGHAAGDVASEVALETFEKYLADACVGSITDWEEHLETAVTAANEAILEEQDEQSDMGTTLVSAVINDGTAIVANVGDSRAYGLTQSDIEQISVDQSLVQQLIEEGHIDEEEAEDHPQRNVISQALGRDEEIDTDFYHVSDIDTVLLCSDGLTEEVDENTIHKHAVTASTHEEAAIELISTANDNGGSDNVSVVIGEV